MNRITPLLFAGVRSRVLTGLLILVLGVFTMLPAVPTQAAGSGTWTLTGSMHTPHNAASATLLQSGQVLVAGGSDASGPLASAELYNPASGTWSTTGSLYTPASSRPTPCSSTGRCWRPAD